MRPTHKKPSKASNGATLGFEAKLWAAADALPNNMDAAEYKHVVLGTPPPGNANHAWVPHFTQPRPPTGFVLANASVSSTQSGEGEIRAAVRHGRPAHA